MNVLCKYEYKIMRMDFVYLLYNYYLKGYTSRQFPEINAVIVYAPFEDKNGIKHNRGEVFRYNMLHNAKQQFEKDFGVKLLDITRAEWEDDEEENRKKLQEIKEK